MQRPNEYPKQNIAKVYFGKYIYLTESIVVIVLSLEQ